MEKSEVFTVDAQLEYMTVQRQHEYIRQSREGVMGSDKPRTLPHSQLWTLSPFFALLMRPVLV
jgi:hypothetical protein